MTFSLQETPQVRELAAIGSSLSLCLYGVVLLLFFTILWLMFHGPTGSSKFIRGFLLAFLTLMVAISTISVGLNLTLNFIFPSAVFSAAAVNSDLCPDFGCSVIRKLDQCCVTLTIWAADGFMIWRCSVVYNGISVLRRRLVLLVCCAMVIAALAAGLLYTIPFSKEDTTLAIFSFITLIINFTVMLLIVLRLLSHKHFLEEALGPGHGRLYLRLIALCVESAALVVMFNIVLIVLALVETGRRFSFILLEMMVQIYVISPFLIIFKVAHDRVYPPNSSMLAENAESTVDGPLKLKALEFAREPSTTTMIIESVLEAEA